MLTIVHRDLKPGESVLVGEGDEKKTVEIKAGQILTDPAVAAAAVNLGCAAARSIVALKKFPYQPKPNAPSVYISERATLDDEKVALYALARPGFARIDPPLPEGVAVSLEYPYTRKASPAELQKIIAANASSAPAAPQSPPSSRSSDEAEGGETEQNE